MAEERTPEEEAKRIEKLLRGVDGIGKKRSEHLIKHFRGRGISTIEDAEAHLKSKEFHSNDDIPRVIRSAVKSHYGSKVEKEEIEALNEEEKTEEEEQKVGEEELKSISEQEKLAVLQRRELKRQIQEREEQEKKKKREKRWGRTKAGFKLGGKAIKWGALGAAGAVVGAASPTGLLILSLTIHIIDLTFNFEAFGLRFLMYFFLTFWSWFTVFGTTQESFLDIKRLKLPLILSTIAFLLPYARTLDFVPKESFDYILVLFPVWVWYTLFSGFFRQTRFLKVVRVIALIIIVVMLYPVAASFAEETGLGKVKIGNVEVNKVVKETKSRVVEGFKEAGKKILSIPKEIKKTYNESISYATGDYYTGKVDRNVREQLGVYITDMETLDPIVYEDEEIEVWATLIAKSIEEPIDLIEVSCEADAHKTLDKKITGKSTITKFPNILDEEEDLDCKFEAGKLEKGSHLITFTAEFDFTTLAYLKTYFIDDKRLKAFKREEIDVFKEYGITDKNPIAIYTNGPVGIGMETKTPPIGISKDYDSTPKFGFTIENKWLGEIKKIKDLIICLPAGIELEDYCDDAFEDLKQNEYDEYNYNFENHKCYRFTKGVTDSELTKWKNIEDYKSRNCRLNIKDADKVLGDTPISVRYIKARIEYIYNSEEYININVKTPEGFNVYFDPKRPTLADFEKGVDCVASHSELYVIKAPFEIYRYRNDEKYDIDEQPLECSAKSHKCEYHFSPEIAKDYFKRGDKIKCKVLKAELSKDEEDSDSAVTTIKNSAPTIQVFFFPQDKVTINDQKLKCIGVIDDKDNDECWVTYEVKINNEKISYDYIDTSWLKDNKQFEISIDLEELKLEENDKISCQMTAIDAPPSDFERKESEPDKAEPVTIGKATETSAGEEGEIEDDCEDKPNGASCEGSKYKNCYNGKCIKACEYLVKTNDNRVGSDWSCECDMSKWSKEECEASDKCIVGYCPGNNYCCSAQAVASK